MTMQGQAVLPPSLPPPPPPQQPKTVEELRRIEQQDKKSKVSQDEVLKNELGAAKKDNDKDNADTGPTVKINEVRFSKSAVFSPEELAEYARSITTVPMTLVQLQKFAAKLTAEYAKRGYPVNLANIPPQKIANGILEIQLIEPEIGSLILVGPQKTSSDDAQPATGEGTKEATKAAQPKAPKYPPYDGALSPSFILSRLRISSGDKLHVPTLEEALVRFNKINRAQLITELTPGEKFATTNLLARVIEPPRLELLAYGDNAGRNNTGFYRATTMVRGSTWLTEADSITLAGVFSEGTRTAYGSYEMPLPFFTSDVLLGASYSYGETKVIRGDYKDLNVLGTSHSGSVHLAYPWIATLTTTLRSTIYATYYHSTTDFVNVLNDKEETTGVTFALEGDHADSKGRWGAGVEFRTGRAWLGDENGPREGYFHKFNLSLSRMQNITPWLSCFGLFGAQGSLKDRLSSSEQMQIGGTSTVRGYSEGALLGEHGYYTRGELWFRPSSLLGKPENNNLISEISHSFSFFAFVDHAGIFPWKTHNLGVQWQDFLTSTGAGVLFNFRDILTAQFTYAYPLGSIPNNTKEQNYLFRVGCRFSF